MKSDKTKHHTISSTKLLRRTFLLGGAISANFYEHKTSAGVTEYLGFIRRTNDETNIAFSEDASNKKDLFRKIRGRLLRELNPEFNRIDQKIKGEIDVI